MFSSSSTFPSALLLGARLLASEPTAATTTEPVPFHLEYQAPPECADEATWLRELARRSARLVRVEVERQAPSLRVMLSVGADGVRAQLTAVDVDGRETSRTLSAATCAEAVQGSAWISALWLDPFASEPQPPAASAPEAAPEPSRPTATPAAVPVQPPSESKPEVTEPNASAAGLRPLLGAGAQVGALFTALPDSPLGFGGFLELQAAQASVVAPALRLGYVSMGEGVGSTARGNARVSLAGLRALACVLKWPSRHRLSLRPCALWELGRLRGSGEQTVAGSTADAPWLSAGVLARVAFEIVPLVSLEVEAGLVFPLRRDRFVFGPPPVVSGFTVPAVAGTLAVGFSIGAALVRP